VQDQEAAFGQGRTGGFGRGAERGARRGERLGQVLAVQAEDRRTALGHQLTNQVGESITTVRSGKYLT